MAYQSGFDGEDGLVEIVARVSTRPSVEADATAGIAPAVLFMEREALRPFGNMGVLEQVMDNVAMVVSVPATMFICAPYDGVDACAASEPVSLPTALAGPSLRDAIGRIERRSYDSPLLAPASNEWGSDPQHGT